MRIIMKLAIVLLAVVLAVVLAGCYGDAASDAPPAPETLTPTPKPTAAPTAMPTLPPSPTPEPTATPAPLSYAELLGTLDGRDIASGSKAVNSLKDMYEGQTVPDADMTALIRFLEDMRPETDSAFPNSIRYERRGLLITDLTLDGMRVFYDNYQSPFFGEGMLYFMPDFVALGRVFYDEVSDAYQDFFEMQHTLAFYELRKLFDDGVAVAGEYKLKHAADIYEAFIEKQPELAEEYDMPMWLNFIYEWIKD